MEQFLPVEFVEQLTFKLYCIFSFNGLYDPQE
jgi:hypothetical protein